MKNPLNEKKIKYFKLKKTLKLTNKVIRLFTEISELRPELQNENEIYINAVGATVFFLENTLKDYADSALELHQAEECKTRKNLTSLKLQ
jgi:hypothetical protein